MGFYSDCMIEEEDTIEQEQEATRDFLARESYMFICGGLVGEIVASTGPEEAEALAAKVRGAVDVLLEDNRISLKVAPVMDLINPEEEWFSPEAIAKEKRFSSKIKGAIKANNHLCSLANGSILNDEEFEARFLPIRNPRLGQDLFFDPEDPDDMLFLNKLGVHHVWTDVEYYGTAEDEVFCMNPGMWHDCFRYCATLKPWSDADAGLMVLSD
jgi:hypothetical protein